jgi:formylmethanofuran dehydrogenase subunit E
MTAKEWIFENYPQVKKEWNKTGHDDNYMVRMMEEYHQAKLKLLGIPDDVGRSEQLVCEECKEPMVEPYAERYDKKFCLGCM